MTSGASQGSAEVQAVIKSAQKDRTVLEGLDWSGLDLRDVDFSICYVVRSRFDGTRFDEASFRSFEATECSFDAAQFLRTSLVKAEFERCSFVAACFDGATLARTAFFGCDLRNAVMDDARSTTRMRCFDSNLRGCSMKRAAMSWTRLMGCDLRDSDFSDCQFEMVEIVADVDGIRLAGATGTLNEESVFITQDEGEMRGGAIGEFCRARGATIELVPYAPPNYK